jgi:hypothetical protein
MIIGFICGAIIVKIWSLSLFCLGALVGFVTWIAIKSIFPELLHNELILYSCLAIPSIIFGFIALRMERLWLLIATPIIGSFFSLQGKKSIYFYYMYIFFFFFFYYYFFLLFHVLIVSIYICFIF